MISNKKSENIEYASPTKHISKQKDISQLIQSDGKIQREQKPSKPILDEIKDIYYKVATNISQLVNSKRTKCNCAGEERIQDNNQTCSKAKKWLLKYYKEQDFPKLKQQYESLIQEKPQDKEITQIAKDLPRTFSDAEFLDLEQLQRVLQIQSVYDPSIGYVQGMNFIAASFLYHAEEHFAFYLMQMIFEDFEMRDIYLTDLPGLTKHCQLIEVLIKKYLPEIYSLFHDNSISTYMYCPQWLFSLFSILVPLKYNSIFYDYLFEQGWIYFYKLVLGILENFKEKLLKMDMIEILQFFNKILLKNYKQQESNVQDIDWEKILYESSLIKIDQKNINLLLENFDSETKQFVV